MSVVLVYMLMVALYESLLTPLAIMFAATQPPPPPAPAPTMAFAGGPSPGDMARPTAPMGAVVDDERERILRVLAECAGSHEGLRWRWEAKSVNSRSLDLRLRIPPGFDGLEPPVRRLRRSGLRRQQRRLLQR